MFGWDADAFVQMEGMWKRIRRVSRAPSGFDEMPRVRIQMWKTYVASECLLDHGQVDAIGYCECMLINLPAAGYKALRVAGCESECLIEAECHFDPRGREGSVARQHDAAPAGEGAPDRLERLTS